MNRKFCFINGVCVMYRILPILICRLAEETIIDVIIGLAERLTTQEQLTKVKQYNFYFLLERFAYIFS